MEIRDASALFIDAAFGGVGPVDVTNSTFSLIGRIGVQYFGAGTSGTTGLEKETVSSVLARHLDEMAWVRWKSANEAGARDLLAVSDALASGSEAMKRVSRARAEGLFAPFLTNLRVVESSPLEADAEGE